MIAALRNFESIAAALHDEAPTEKARGFTDKIATQIRAKGDAWIDSHINALHLEHDAAWHDDIAPVEDNRLWWLAEWQMALAS